MHYIEKQGLWHLTQHGIKAKIGELKTIIRRVKGKHNEDKADV